MIYVFDYIYKNICHIHGIIILTNYMFDTVWSKINSYYKYLEFQKYFISQYDGVPLDVEFNMWLRKEY